MKRLAKKLCAFLLFLVIGALINLVLGCSVGAVFYAPDNSFEYTSDGKCSFGDFAWYELCIDFENGKVSKITSRWMYD